MPTWDCCFLDLRFDGLNLQTSDRLADRVDLCFSTTAPILLAASSQQLLDVFWVWDHLCSLTKSTIDTSLNRRSGLLLGIINSLERTTCAQCFRTPSMSYSLVLPQGMLQILSEFLKGKYICRGEGNGEGG